MLDQITPVILTRDEEANIARTLEGLRWAREAIVVDSFSTDRTLEIARGFPNVRVVQRAFDGFALQWTFAMEHVRTPWFLALDADYVVTAGTVEELRSLVPGAIRGYKAPFVYAIGGKPLRASLYPPRIVLAKKENVSFVQDGHAQRLLVDGAIGELRTPLIHDDRKDFKRFVERQRIYMKQEAAKLRNADPRSLNLPARIRKLVVIAPFAALVHTLFVKGLILDGTAGLRYVWERVVAELILSRELMRSAESSDRPSPADPSSS